MRELIRGPKPDVLWTLGVDRSTYGALALARLRKIPTVVKLTLEGEDDPVTLSRRSFGFLRLTLVRAAEAVVCPSRRLVELTAQSGFDPSRVHHVPNGVDLTRFQPPAPGTRNSHAIAWVGAVTERKRPDLALGALLPLFPCFPNLEFHMIGGLGRTPKARQFGETFLASIPEAVRARVILHGSTETPEAILARAGFLLLPSEAEGLPNSVLEAMACGTIPVVSDLPALHEAVDDTVGRFVPTMQTADWTRTVEELLSSTESLGNMRAAARRRVEERFDLEETARCYEAIFRQLAGREST
jgi:glycosyltransferase involved in cell wall biosynthesis